MLYKNAYVFTEENRFIFGGFTVENGRFSSVYCGDNSENGIDLDGAYVIPGLIDIHTHGNSGFDFSDGNPSGLEKMASYYASKGITSFVPASMTLPYDLLERAFVTAAGYAESRRENSARLMGIHMEGPFLSNSKKGAQNGEYLKAPDIDSFLRLYQSCGGLIRIVDIAAELDGAAEFASAASKMCTVSIAHTNADYEISSILFDNGASHLTHLFNGMPQIHHRQPGVIGAGAERDNVTAELICDGLHVHPSIVRLAFKMFPGRICLVSDSLRCCGMPDGEYDIGGQRAYLKDTVAKLADGTLAGSALNIYDGMLNAVRFGITKEAAVEAATYLPAKVIGCSDLIGRIRDGLFADFVVCDSDLNMKKVYISGIEYKS